MTLPTFPAPLSSMLSIALSTDRVREGVGIGTATGSWHYLLVAMCAWDSVDPRWEHIFLCCRGFFSIHTRAREHIIYFFIQLSIFTTLTLLCLLFKGNRFEVIVTSGAAVIFNGAIHEHAVLEIIPGTQPSWWVRSKEIQFYLSIYFHT